MGGVDLKDQLLHPYFIERKQMSKWNIKIFYRLLNAIIIQYIGITWGKQMISYDSEFSQLKD